VRKAKGASSESLSGITREDARKRGLIKLDLAVMIKGA